MRDMYCQDEDSCEGALCWLQTLAARCTCVRTLLAMCVVRAHGSFVYAVRRLVLSSATYVCAYARQGASVRCLLLEQVVCVLAGNLVGMVRCGQVLAQSVPHSLMHIITECVIRVIP